MWRITPQRRFATAIAVIVLAAAIPALAVPIDSTLFTTYTINTTHTSLDWVVCGSTQSSSGCYASGALGPFAKVGAILEGNQSVNLTTNTVTRLIYVLDIATGNTQNGVTLYVYKKTDTISPTFDTVNVSLTKTVTLSQIVGGALARASMAANAKFLFIGTNQSPTALKVQKGTYAITQIGGFSPPINVTSITTNKYGYATVTFGSFNGPSNGFVVFDPSGNSKEDGGGASFMLNTDQAVLPATFP